MRRFGLMVVLLAGCSNEPGSLTITLSSERATIFVDEPIRLHVLLETADARICLARTRHYRLEMRVVAPRTAGNEPLTSTTPIVCGTWLVIGWPVSPVIIATALSDVADLTGRFDVMRPNDHRQDVLEIEPNPRHWNPDLLQVRRNSVPTNQSPMHNWSPGHYQLDVRLVNRHLGLMPPLFWEPYSHPLDGTVRVTIVERGDG